MSGEIDASEATPRDDAIRLLARREHSRHELTERLTAKGYESADIGECLDTLAEQGLQSDARFTEVFLRSRVALGQGPLKICIELERRGVEREQIRATFEMLEGDGEFDWCRQASEVLARRFSGPGSTPRERARRERFLAGRGFDFDQVRYAMVHAWSD